MKLRRSLGVERIRFLVVEEDQQVLADPFEPTSLCQPRGGSWERICEQVLQNAISTAASHGMNLDAPSPIVGIQGIRPVLFGVSNTQIRVTLEVIPIVPILDKEQGDLADLRNGCERRGNLPRPNRVGK